MSDFEDRLLGALKEEIATRKADDRMTTVTPARDGSRRRIVGLSAAVAGVAAAATAVVAATGVLGGPAYAVTRDADGGVSVRIHAFTDPGGLEAELAEAGVRAVVDYLPQGQTCKRPRGTHGGGSGEFAAGIGRDGDGIGFEIEKGQVPEGSTLVLTVSKSEDGDDRPPFATTLEIVEGAVADCEPVSMPVPGEGDGSGFDTSTDEEGQGPSLNSRTG
ncbi:hypothetical protein [Nonomuraea gerenzanensis]|uniref:Uncharacterized protein n=1 Tax=Nonomuraea gerenzanensis TaxID=93944 RepID=A0A1M4EPX9_9ACTN|nr:hypothetical protein [Nonomuraea gerenzanensis]UBU12374.1 hypothetical protein LCN96_50225 [Nonomuraea gerenzanensis]SBP00921.1 hypothetical protein BN4615_P10437 [Nonomuraea gerenzanensis]